MQRILPRESKIKISFWRGITVSDLLLGLLGLLLFAIIVSGGGAIKIVCGIFFLCVYSALFFNIGGERGYYLLFYTLKYLVSNNIFTKQGKQKTNIEIFRRSKPLP